MKIHEVRLPQYILTFTGVANNIITIFLPIFIPLEKIRSLPPQTALWTCDSVEEARQGEEGWVVPSGPWQRGGKERGAHVPPNLLITLSIPHQGYDERQYLKLHDGPHLFTFSCFFMMWLSLQSSDTGFITPSESWTPISFNGIINNFSLIIFEIPTHGCLPRTYFN